MKRLILAVFISLMMISTLFLCSCVINKSTNLKVTVLKVGKADSIVLESDNMTMVIDCGTKKKGDDVCDFLTSENIKKIDYLIITHYDQDHVGGAAKVMKNFEVKKIYAANYTENSKNYDRFEKEVEENNIDITRPDSDVSFTADNIKFTINVADRTDYSTAFDNNSSLIVSAINGDNSFLFAADAVEERLSEIMDIGQFDFLKVPYHGRDIANFDEFLDEVQPKYSVISSSDSDYSEKIIEELKNHGSEVYLTADDGNVTVTSDGKNMKVTTEN